MLLRTIIIVFGLSLFEIISSVDNAIINAHVLKTVPEKYRQIFLFWGLLFAVFIIRGVLPFAIVWGTNPGLSFGEMLRTAFSQNEQVQTSVLGAKPLLLLGGGIYLFLTFLSWLFMEEKKYAFLVESFIHSKSIWFYAISSIFMTLVVYYSVKIDPVLALSASVGATAFFITDGFKKNAQANENILANTHISAWSKILFLEVLDASFSIDGVVGAFAFTLSIPLIILGNGLGAFIVRELTIRGLTTLTKFAYLKNGAMYSIGMLGLVMTLEAFGKVYPFWLAPLNTFLLLSLFLFLSYKEIREAGDLS